MHDPGMEARVERLEQDMHEVRATLGRLEPMIVSIHAQIPYLASKAEMAELRGEMKADFEGLRGEVKADIEALRGEVKADIEALRGEVKADIEALRGEVKSDVAMLRGEVSRKPGIAAMWSMGLSLFTLVVAAIAAGAAYLPLLSNALHQAP